MADSAKHCETPVAPMTSQAFGHVIWDKRMSKKLLSSLHKENMTVLS